jgi:hypothetical protein
VVDGEFSIVVRLASDTEAIAEEALLKTVAHWNNEARLDFYVVRPKSVLGALWTRLSARYLIERRFDEAAAAILNAQEQYDILMELWSFSVEEPALRLAAATYNASALHWMQSSREGSAYYCEAALEKLALVVSERDKNESYQVVARTLKNQAALLQSVGINFKVAGELR